MLPFVIGDSLKLVAAGALLPLAWRLAPSSGKSSSEDVPKNPL
jgi:hypothetical protein